MENDLLLEFLQAKSFLETFEKERIEQGDKFIHENFLRLSRVKLKLVIDQGVEQNLPYFINLRKQYNDLYTCEEN